MENIEDLCGYVDYVSARIEVNDVTRTSRLTSNNVTSSSEFLEVLGSLFLGLSEDVSSLEADDVLAVQSLSVDTALRTTFSRYLLKSSLPAQKWAPSARQERNLQLGQY